MSSPSSPRRSWPLWTAFVLFLVAVACVPLVSRRVKHQPKVWDLPALADHVRQTHPKLHIIPFWLGDNTRNGFFLSTQADSWKAAHELTAAPISKWSGIILCKPSHSIPVEQDAMWADSCRRLNGVVLLGDPRVIHLVIAGLSDETESY